MVSRPLIPELPALRARFLDSGHILLGLDFDGTLAPIAPRPADAVLPPETVAILSSLAASEQVSVAILSGRSIASLKAKTSLDVIYCGNHGLEIEGPGISFLHEGATLLRNTLDLACWDLEAAFQGVCGVLVERKGLTATVHHRHAPAELDGWIEATVRLVLQPYSARLSIRAALESWEIRPSVAWNKGSALKLLADRMATARLTVVCAGDDATDEDMFRVLPDAISIRVGASAPTGALYHVGGPPELLQFLRFLESAVRAGPALPSRAAPPRKRQYRKVSRAAAGGRSRGRGPSGERRSAAPS
jgi:trehalose-phosphatase